MACHRGTFGILKIHSADKRTDADAAQVEAIAEMQSYTIDETADTFECTAFGDEYRKFDFSFKSWEATIEANWDVKRDNYDDTGVIDPALNDTTANEDAYAAGKGGQAFFTAGNYAEVEFYPQGETEVGGAVWSGKALITGVSINASFDSVISMSITLQGTETLNKGWEQTANA